MLKQTFLFRDSEAEESHWKSGILSTEFKDKTERGCCKLLDAATIQRPKQLSSAQNEEDREDNMQENFCLVRSIYLQKFSVGLK